jgi:hypothetical protein
MVLVLSRQVKVPPGKLALAVTMPEPVQEIIFGISTVTTGSGRMVTVAVALCEQLLGAGLVMVSV